MQTAFTPDQLKDPATRESEKILRTCVHCGFCTATCPTYLLLGDELDSPRGRIYLIKDMLENSRPATTEVVKHIDRCLSCLSCMTTCPSGVHYMHLVDHARAYIEDTYERPRHDRALRALLARVLPHRNRLRLALLAAKAGKPFSRLFGAVPLAGDRLRAMLDLAPGALPSRSPVEKPGVHRAEGPRRGRVALLNGCAQPVLDPGINDATVRLLNRHGVEVVVPRGEGCCGALVHHMGQEGQAHGFAKANIDAWTREIEGEGLDAIIITTSGCGTTIKDYGFMLREDEAYAGKARGVSELAKDVSEYLLTLGLQPRREADLTVAYHAACSIQHGQQIKDAPKAVLRSLGYRVKDIPEGHVCCGSAGVYNILQPEIAGQLRERKVANIERVRGAQVLATGNIGCMTQIARGFRDRGTGLPIVHLVELADWATGGPMPRALEDARFEERPMLEPPRLAAE